MRQARGHRGTSWLIIALLFLSGCAGLPVERQERPKARPSVTQPIIPTSEASARLRTYLASVERAQLARGLLRRDGGGPDTPIRADLLKRNFEQIAFFDEYRRLDTVPPDAQRLRRWDSPVRIRTIFGPSVPPSQREKDKANVAAYSERLARVTNHPITTRGMANFLVYFVSEDDRVQTIQETASAALGVDEAALAPILDLDERIYCAVITFSSPRKPSTYRAAIAVIRAENPNLLRLSCIHEELAQGLGLANDSPEARPSIFNDDDEFALLTSHDELLLRFLYDPRLKTGIRLDEADPILTALAQEAPGVLP